MSSPSELLDAATANAHTHTTSEIANNAKQTPALIASPEEKPTTAGTEPSAKSALLTHEATTMRPPARSASMPAG